MKELNKNCVYSLEDLTSEEKKELLEPLNLIGIKKANYLSFGEPFGWVLGTFHNKETHNAKELFYTLENIQVDCRELSEDQIKEMADVFEKAGYKVDTDNLYVRKNYKFLKYSKGCNTVWVYLVGDNKTTITYQKFMELFAGSEQVEVNIEAEINIVQFPEHYDNTNGSIYKFCNDQKLNSWEFDIIKRVVRCRKKGLFKEDLQKTKDLIDLYLKEFTDEK